MRRFVLLFVTRAYVGASLIVCPGLLAGCGASFVDLPSLNKATLNSDLETGAVANDTLPDNKTDAGAAPKFEGEPASLAQAVALEPHSKQGSELVSFAKAAEPFISTATPGNTAYKIGPQDVLDISVFKVPELTRSVVVSHVGTINLPLVGEVQAAGKTAREIEHDLTAQLGAEYLQSPQVTVAVKEYNSQRVTIDGAVKKPGVYPIRSKTTLLQLTAMAGGLQDSADHSGLVIMRQDKGKRSARTFNINDIRAGRTEDPPLEQGDVVVVSHSAMKATWQTFLKGLGAAGSAAIFF